MCFLSFSGENKSTVGDETYFAFQNVRETDIGYLELSNIFLEIKNYAFE